MSISIILSFYKAKFIMVFGFEEKPMSKNQHGYGLTQRHSKTDKQTLIRSLLNWSIHPFIFVDLTGMYLKMRQTTKSLSKVSALIKAPKKCNRLGYSKD